MNKSHRHSNGRKDARRFRREFRDLWSNEFSRDLAVRVHFHLKISVAILVDIRKRLSRAAHKKDRSLFQAISKAQTVVQTVIMLTEPANREEFDAKAQALLLKPLHLRPPAFYVAAEAVLIEDAVRLGITDSAIFARFHQRDA